jgi:L-amino acid N-acyltransferase YncA
MIVVRVLTLEDDFKKFRALRLKALSESPMAYGIAVSDESGRTEDEWRKICREKCYVIAEYEGEFIGMLGASEFFGSYIRHQVEIISAYIDPRFRGQGVMRRIFELLKSELQKKNYLEQMIVWVTLHEGQASRFVFEKFGFKFAGVLSKAVKINDRYYDCCWLESFLYA